MSLLMNEFRTDFWDRHGANIAAHLKEMYGERLFRRTKKNERFG